MLRSKKGWDEGIGICLISPRPVQIRFLLQRLFARNAAERGKSREKAARSGEKDGLSAGLLPRLECHNHRGVGLEIFPRCRFDLRKRDRFVKGVLTLTVGVAKAVEFIKSGGYGEMTEILPGDFSLADDLRLAAAEFFFRQAFVAQ